MVRRRFDEAVIERLLALRWWDWPVERIQRHLRDITAGNVAALETGEAANERA